MKACFAGVLTLFISIAAGAGVHVPGSSRAQEDALLAEAPQVQPYEIKHVPRLVWSNVFHPERARWRDYAFSVINLTFDKLDVAQDMTEFCPNYRAIARDQKIIAWMQLFEAIAYFESSFDPANRTLETTSNAGIDEVTGLPVYSEGLLQLSYQDIEQDDVGPMCHFDWAHDKVLQPTDRHRTILNPYTNLFCGIHLMAKYISDNAGRIVVPDHYYWSTLQIGNKAEDKSAEMKRMVQRLGFCRKR